MKKLVFVSGLLLFAATLPAFAEPPMDGMVMRENTAQATHQGTGKVVAVNREKLSIKLAHEPIKSLGWPGMTMNFDVEKTSLLDGLKAGDSVRFELVQAKPKKWQIAKIERK